MLSYSETLDNYGANFFNTWNSTTSYHLLSAQRIGMSYVVQYTVYRDFLCFDTSTVPSGANITSAILKIYPTVDSSVTDFNVTIQNGQPIHPSIPVVTSDYYQGYYSGDGGSRNTGDGMSVGSYWNIPLSADGLSWVNSTSVTKFALRSSRDIAEITPSGNEMITIDSSTYAPILYLTYTYSPAYTYVTRGAYYEDGSIPILNTSITLYRNGEPPETRIMHVDVEGVEDVETWYSNVQAYYFTWNISAPSMNMTRSYWVSNETFQNIYIFVPNPETSVYQYRFTVNDISGMTSAYLETDINVEGFERLVERKSVSTVNPVTFWMSQFKLYSLILVCNKGTYVFGNGFEAGSVFDQELTTSQLSFPVTYSFFNVSIGAVRTNTTYCEVYYMDNAGLTTALNVSFIYQSGWTWANQYTSLSSSQNTTVAYSSLDPSTDYVADIIATRSDAVYHWNIPLPIPNNMSTNIWSSLDALYPDSPVPVSNFLGLFLIFCIFAIFSYVYVELAMFLAVIFNIIFVAIGMMQTPITILAFAMCLVVFVAIKRQKMRGQEE